MGVLALVGAALAEPEADPLFYSGYTGLYNGYSGYTGLGYTGLPHVGSYISPAYTGFTGYHTLGKREAEAEAEPEADPLLYRSTYSGLASPLVRSVYNPVSTYGSIVAPVSTYGSYIRPAYTGYTGYHGLGKREAEAEAEPEADPLLYRSTYSGLASPLVR